MRTAAMTSASAETRTTTGLLTLDAWIASYDRQPVEVVEGESIPMHPPTRPHMRISRDLLLSISAFLADHPLGEAWPDNTPYVLQEEDMEGETWVKGARVPDVSFVSQERIAVHNAQHGEDGPWRLAPDLAVEIISPNDSYSDIHRKIADYLNAGTRLVWIVDPANRVVRVHTSDDPDGFTLSEADTLQGDPVLPGYRIGVGEVLDGPANR